MNGESEDFILFDKALANPNYIPVYMKVYYLFTLCIFVYSLGMTTCRHEGTYLESLYPRI